MTATTPLTVDAEEASNDGALCHAHCPTWERDMQGLLDLLAEAQRQIVYLHEKFNATGTGNAVLSRIEAALAKGTT